MAGYWQVPFFLFMFVDQDGIEAHTQAKKEHGQYPAILLNKLGQ